MLYLRSNVMLYLRHKTVQLANLIIKHSLPLNLNVGKGVICVLLTFLQYKLIVLAHSILIVIFF